MALCYGGGDGITSEEQDLGTYSSIEGRSSIGCWWVYKVKKDTDENIERFKAHLMVKGYV